MRPQANAEAGTEMSSLKTEKGEKRNKESHGESYNVRRGVALSNLQWVNCVARFVMVNMECVDSLICFPTLLYSYKHY